MCGDNVPSAGEAVRTPEAAVRAKRPGKSASFIS